MRRETWLQEIVDLLKIDSDDEALRVISEISSVDDAREVICLEAGKDAVKPTSKKSNRLLKKTSSIH